ncbi:hypothetical protein Tco_0994426, partial [Tanacetum coccineum]
VSCIDDLDFFKDFENEFPAIVYNDALMSKSDFSTEPTLCPQHIDELDLKDETSLPKYDEDKQNVLYFNDLFLFNIIYPDDLKSDKDNDNKEIDMIKSSGGFVMELNINIVAWNYLVNGMLFNLIKNLYVPFAIPFDPKWYYKDGDCTRMLRRPRTLGLGSLYTLEDISDLVNFTNMALPPRDQRHQYLRVQVFDFRGLPDLIAEGLSSRMLIEHRDAQGQSMFTSRAWRQLFDIKGPLVHELILEFFSTFRDPILRLCHRLITCSIAGRSQALEKVTVTDLFYLRGMDVGSVNVPYLLARYLRLFASGRKQGVMISGGEFVAHLAEHFGLLTKEWLQGLTAWVALGPERQPNAMAAALEAAEDVPIADDGASAILTPVQAPQPPPLVAGLARTMAQRFTRVEEDVHEIRGALGEQREILDSMARDFSRFYTWTVNELSQMMSQVGVRFTSYADF